jgi:hypothetical protein
MDWRVVRIMVSYQIKRKREKKGGAARKKKENSHPFLLYLKLCFHPLSSLVF